MMPRRWKAWRSTFGIVALILFIYGIYQKLEDITDLQSCPACYGQTKCSALVDDDPLIDKIELISFSKWKILNLINIKNVYYGKMGSMLVVLKKLAHNSELSEFDSMLCRAAEQIENCNTSQAMKILFTNSGEDVVKVVKKYPELFDSSDAVRCNHSKTVEKLYDNFKKTDSGPYFQHHFLTMLSINIEPLVIMTYHSAFFPKLIGTCGRVIIEEYVGPSLTHKSNEPWFVRADYARQLLEIAQHFSEGPFLLYLTDVSLDNFAVDDNGRVKVIDAENIVIVDSSFKGLDRSEHVNDGFGCADCLSFSYEDLCGHSFSDHNFYAVCKGMLSSSAFSEDLPEGLLHSPPDWVLKKYPELFSVLEECSHHPINNPNMPTSDRRKAAKHLHELLVSVLMEFN